MNSNLKLLLTVVSAAGAMMFCGCSNDDEPIENIAFVEEGNVKPSQKAESKQPTAILGSGGTMSAVLSQTFTNIVEVGKAKHVIVACNELDDYKDDLLLAYKKGAVITVTDPDAAKLDAWCEVNGMVFAGDPIAIDACTLVSFNRKAASISIQKGKGKGKDLIEEEDVPLVIFTGWLDKILTPNMMGPDYRSKDIKKRFTPQHVSQGELV